MIEINPNLKAKCSECEMFEPKMDVQRTYADSTCYLTTVNVSCEKAKMCDNLDQYLRKVLGKEDTSYGER